MSETLLTDVEALLRRASAALPPEERAEVDEAARRLREPLRVALAGRVKAGKSTLLNALVGEELAPTDASECTRIVTWYRNGMSYQVLAHLRAGGSTAVPFERTEHAVTVQLGALSADAVDRLEVHWPSSRLEEMTLIDTPGVESVSTDVAARAEAFIDPEDGEASAADALLYLMQHTHPGDVRLLEAFRDDQLGQGTPVSAVGVLSRADEIGSCRLDAVAVADTAAKRYLATPELHRLCLTVVPVAGLAGQAASTLTEREYQALAALASISASELSSQLLTADRFVGPDADDETAAVSRRELLDRLGVYGVRLAIDAIRSRRVSSSRALASELLTASGLPVLRSVLATHFAGRSQVLKARTGLLTLERALRSRPEDGQTAAILRDAERLRAGVHAFTEIRVLTALRSGQLDVDPELRAELERTLGGDGDTPLIRVAADDDATDADIQREATDQLQRWRRLADHPLSSRAVVDAALAAARSCEGILATLADGADAPEPKPDPPPSSGITYF